MTDKHVFQSVYRKKEILILFLISLVVFIVSTLRVQDIVSIWNQNDEFGAWQGGAWILGLDWSEVVSANYYYGHGYGFILAFFIKIFGNNSVFMTHMAIYFQAFMHTGCIFIAWYCIRKMFPSVDAVVRIIGASVCILTIPDLFYIYMFYSECILRFLVWVTFGLVVSYSYNKKWYKLLLINVIAIWAFSIHQRCILLVACAFFLFMHEAIVSVYKGKSKARTLVGVIILLLVMIAVYCIAYKYAQKIYIEELYSADGHRNGDNNLLSERGYTLNSILKDVVFNLEIECIAVQNLMGLIYYICAYDCGFAFYGFILCFDKIKERLLSKQNSIVMPYAYMGCMTLIGIVLVAYQNAGEWVYNRVELMHYGRYCSYLLAPMVMTGIVSVLTESTCRLGKKANYVVIIFVISGIITHNILQSHNVTNLYAFANTCPGIKSVYYTDGPLQAVLYHTLVGFMWILISAVVMIMSKKNIRNKRIVEIGLFVFVSVVWINIADREWREQYDAQKTYVTQTYDLQKVLKDEEEFAAFKSFEHYGSGLLQYNNMFSKLHIVQALEELGSDENGLLVVSGKGIEEMDEIYRNYYIVYENERYFVWRYEMSKDREL